MLSDAYMADIEYNKQLISIVHYIHNKSNIFFGTKGKTIFLCYLVNIVKNVTVRSLLAQILFYLCVINTTADCAIIPKC